MDGAPMDCSPRSPPSPSLVPASPTRRCAGLTRSLRHDDVGYVREAAAEALGKIGPFAASAVTALIEAEKDRPRSVCTAATESLGKIGAEARRSISVLIELLAEISADSPGGDSIPGRFGPEAHAACAVDQSHPRCTLRRRKPDYVRRRGRGRSRGNRPSAVSHAHQAAFLFRHAFFSSH